MRFAHFRFPVISIFFLLLGLAWIWASRVRDIAAFRERLAEPQAGFPAPDFQLTSLDGESLSLSQFAGQAVIVNFWASWCSPCKAEMPALERVYRENLSEGLVILGVNATHQDSPRAVSQFVQAQGLTFPVLMDSDGGASRRYRTQALPTTFFIDRTGVIREVIIGGPMAEALLRIRVMNLLESAP